FRLRLSLEAFAREALGEDVDVRRDAFGTERVGRLSDRGRDRLAVVDALELLGKPVGRGIEVHLQRRIGVLLDLALPHSRQYSTSFGEEVVSEGLRGGRRLSRRLWPPAGSGRTASTCGPRAGRAPCSAPRAPSRASVLCPSSRGCR